MFSDPSPTLPLQLAIQMKMNLGSYLMPYSIICSKLITVDLKCKKFIKLIEENTGENQCCLRLSK